MSRKYYVLFSIVQNYTPRIYKTRVTAVRHQEANPNLQFELFLTEEEASEFINNIPKLKEKHQPIKQAKTPDLVQFAKGPSGTHSEFVNSTSTAQKAQAGLEVSQKQWKAIQRASEPSVASGQSIRSSLEVQTDRQKKSQRGKDNKSDSTTKNKLSTQEEQQLPNGSTTKFAEAATLRLKRPRLDASTVPSFLRNYSKSKLLHPVNLESISELKASSHMRQNPGLCWIQYSIMNSQLPIIYREYILGQKYRLEGQLLALSYGMWDAYLNSLRRIDCVTQCNSLYKILHQRNQNTIDPKIRSLRSLLSELEKGFDQVHYVQGVKAAPIPKIQSID